MQMVNQVDAKESGQRERFPSGAELDSTWWKARPERDSAWRRDDREMQSNEAAICTQSAQDPDRLSAKTPRSMLKVIALKSILVMADGSTSFNVPVRKMHAPK